MITQRRKIFFFLTIAALLWAGAVLFVPEVFAADGDTEASAVQAGLDTAAAETGLAQADLPMVIAKIIRTVLGFLGIIAVCIVLWGGFRWMTAGGDDEKVATAKKILLNGVIGLMIVLFSMAIVQFIIGALVGSMSGTGGESPEGDGDCPPFGICGGGDPLTFSVSGYSPIGAVPIRNVKGIVTFSRSIDATSFNQDSIQVFSCDTADCLNTSAEVDVFLSNTSNKITFEPVATCPAPNEDRKCFDADSHFLVQVLDGIKSSTGIPLNCDAGKGCTNKFSTGNLVDVDDPTVTIEYPHRNDRLEPGPPVMFQISATDDSQIGWGDFYVDGQIFDTIVATGDDLSNVTIETTWITDGSPDDANYTLSATVTDIAGNEDTDSITVRLLPIHCFDRVMNEDETDVDCGGSCGVCNGGACEEDADCVVGSRCDNNICVGYPMIMGVSPKRGALGNFVTVTGKNFGAAEGTVGFWNGDNFTAAEIAACSYGWSDTQVIVIVPDEAITGPVSVRAADGIRDVSNNDWGPKVPNANGNFIINDQVSPNLCRITPNYGYSGSNVKLTGESFGTTQAADSKVLFGTIEARTFTNWGDSEINVNVPTAPIDIYDIAVEVGGIASNAIPFSIWEQRDQVGPIITEVVPGAGGIGQYVTILGSNFGSRPGDVRFSSRSAVAEAIGSIDFPDECADTFWTDDQITIIVPENYAGGSIPLQFETHDLFIRTQTGAVSEPVAFDVTSADPTPGVCAIEPNRGEEDDIVTLYGANFGQTEGSVEFWVSSPATIQSSGWSDEEISLKVPGGANTGPVKVVSAGGDSNPVNFEIGAEGVSPGPVPGIAEYAWVFSTGEIKIAPYVEFICTDDRLSGVPNTQYTQEACINVEVLFDFSTLMKEITLNDNSIYVEECQDQNCSTSTTVPRGDLKVSDNASYTTVTWTPSATYNTDKPGRVLPGKTYKVVVKADVESAGSVKMDGDEIWYFTTGPVNDDCEVELVRVSPARETLTAKNETTEFLAVPGTADCQSLNAILFSWNWDIDPSIATLEAGVCDNISEDYCAVATALAEGVAQVKAEELRSGVWGDAGLTIDFTDPYVMNFWPSCDTACVNAEIGAQFNVPMKPASIGTLGMVTLQSCTNELCTSFNTVEDDIASCANDDCSKISVQFSGGVGEPSTFYRVIISGNVESTSDVKLIRPNYGNDFSWIFSTKDDDTLCAVSRINLGPDNVRLNAVRDKQIYSVDPFGEADDCSEAGQRLDGYSYNWNWQDPIIEDPYIAEWLKSAQGSIADGDPNNPVEGCTSSCLAVGSQPLKAICGIDADGLNGLLDPGEDCDDGNTIPGDGCSDNCLAEGANSDSIDVCTRTCSTSGEACVTNADCDTVNSETCVVAAGICCGNSRREYIPTTGAGEECDDGNNLDGDGCSAMCLNEGSRILGLTCGNLDIAHQNDIGGEDCDDGNRLSNDGCSADCLNEGSARQ
ncbi:MAG: IPT/TIG domain-containing protein, partial [Patescibacteria group bacterium]